MERKQLKKKTFAKAVYFLEVFLYKSFLLTVPCYRCL